MDDPMEEAAILDGPMRLLLLTTARINRLQDQVLADLEVPLTSRQYRVLSRVYEGHNSPSVLARLARRSLPTLSETIDGMVRRGLLTRMSSEHDRRAVVLGLTPAGEKALRSATDTMFRLGRDLVGTLPDGAIEELTGRLDHLYRVAEKYLEVKG